MSERSKPQLRAVLLPVALLAVAGAWIYAVFSFLAEQPRFFRSPTQVLKSDQEWYDRVFDPAMRTAVPDLLSYPAPRTPLERVPASSSVHEEVIVSCKVPKFPSSNRLYELFQADESGLVTLPDGNL